MWNLYICICENITHEISISSFIAPMGTDDSTLSVELHLRTAGEIRCNFFIPSSNVLIFSFNITFSFSRSDSERTPLSSWLVLERVEVKSGIGGGDTALSRSS